MNSKMIRMYRYIYLLGAVLETAWGLYMQYFSPSLGSDNMTLRVTCSLVSLTAGILTFKKDFFAKNCRLIINIVGTVFVIQRYILLFHNQEDYLYIIDLYTMFILCMVTFPSKKDMYYFGSLYLLPSLLFPAHDYVVISNLITVAPLVGMLKWQFFKILEENEVQRKKLEDVHVMEGAKNLMTSMSHYVNNYLESINLSNQMLYYENNDKYRKNISSNIAEIKNIFSSFRDSLASSSDQDEEVSLDNEVSSILEKYQNGFENKSNLKVLCNKPILRASLNCVIDNAYYINKKNQVEGIGVEIYEDSHFAYIDIEDTASKLPVEDNEKIFKPFYSTKDINEGMGLSLSISRELIQKNGGDIFVKSNYPTIICIKVKKCQ